MESVGNERALDVGVGNESAPSVGIQDVAVTAGACKSTVFYRTPAPIIVYYFPYITCLLYLLFLIKHVRTSG